jgi:hypothetical protein
MEDNSMAVVEEAEEEEEEDVEVELFRPLDLLLFLVLGMQMQVLFYIFLSGVIFLNFIFFWGNFPL